MDLMAINLGMRLGGGGGGTSDAYTKAETDALLDGKADLVDGKVPASELPSYVDDTVEGYYYEGAFYEDSEHTTAIAGEAGKIYIDLTANKSYRWTGTVYVRIDECPAFGETQGTIYEGNKGKANADAIGTLSSLTTTAKSSLVAAINELDADKVDAVSGKVLSSNDFTDAEKTKLSGISAGAEVNVQADWSQSDSSSDDFIKNKPSILELGETATTAYAGNKGKQNADAIAAIKDGTSIDSFADVETALASKEQIDIESSNIIESDVDNYSAGIVCGYSSSFAGSTSAWVVVRTYILNAEASRKMQIVDMYDVDASTASTKTRFYKGTWSAWM